MGTTQSSDKKKPATAAAAAATRPARPTYDSKDIESWGPRDVAQNWLRAVMYAPAAAPASMGRGSGGAALTANAIVDGVVTSIAAALHELRMDDGPGLIALHSDARVWAVFEAELRRRLVLESQSAATQASIAAALSKFRAAVGDACAVYCNERALFIPMIPLNPETDKDFMKKRKRIPKPLPAAGGESDALRVVLHYHAETENGVAFGAPALSRHWALQPRTIRHYYGCAGGNNFRLRIPQAVNPRVANDEKREYTNLPYRVLRDAYEWSDRKLTPRTSANASASAGAPRASRLVSPELLSALLYHSVAMSGRKEQASADGGGMSRGQFTKRVNASSGGLHPVETYVIRPHYYHKPTAATATRQEIMGAAPTDAATEGISLSHYDVRRHALEERYRWTSALVDDARSKSDASYVDFGQFFAALSARFGVSRDELCLFGVTSIDWREIWKYGSRAFRYTQLDIGHAYGSIAIGAALYGRRAVRLRLSDAVIRRLLLGPPVPVATPPPPQLKPATAVAAAAASSPDTAASTTAPAPAAAAAAAAYVSELEAEWPAFVVALVPADAPYFSQPESTAAFGACDLTADDALLPAAPAASTAAASTSTTATAPASLWSGFPDPQSDSHTRWPVVDAVRVVTVLPPLPRVEATAAAAATAATATAASPATTPNAPTATSALDSKAAAGDESNICAVIRSRRSALVYDPEQTIPLDSFLSILSRVSNAGSFPCDGLRLQSAGTVPALGVFVQRVDALPAGYYMLVRNVASLTALQSATAHKQFKWKLIPEANARGILLYYLATPTEADVIAIARPTPPPAATASAAAGGTGADSKSAAVPVRDVVSAQAALTSCHQGISRTAAFTIAAFTSVLAPQPTTVVPAAATGFLYRATHWEAGIIGQTLYVESERLGLSATGLGCFLDEPSRVTFGFFTPPPLLQPATDATAIDQKSIATPVNAAAVTAPGTEAATAAATATATAAPAAPAAAEVVPAFQAVYHFCVGVADRQSLDYQKYHPYNYEADLFD